MVVTEGTFYSLWASILGSNGVSSLQSSPSEEVLTVLLRMADLKQSSRYMLKDMEQERVA